MKSFKTFVTEEGEGRIYLDMDGVLADFIDGVLVHFKKDRKDRTITKEFSDMATEIQDKSRAGELPGFWENLSVLSEGKKLYRYVKTLNKDIWVLSSCSRDMKYCFREKHKWIKKHFPKITSEKVILVASAKHKSRYAKPGDILIDDFKKNIQRWEQEGGTGIWHNGDVSKTMREIKKVL